MTNLSEFVSNRHESIDAVLQLDAYYTDMKTPFC